MSNGGQFFESQQVELYHPQLVDMPYTPQLRNMYNSQPMEREMYQPNQSVEPAELIVLPQPVEPYNPIQMNPKPPMEFCPRSAELYYPEQADLYESQRVHEPYCPQAVGRGNHQLVQYQPSPLPPRVTNPNSISESDEFRMFVFKVQQCPNRRSHHWPSCPFAHSGEKARRRDPTKYHYHSDMCSRYSKSKNSKCYYGNACHYAHGKFEYWLHPARYRTVYCRFGLNCYRPVCFFAHSYAELRIVSRPLRCSCHYAPRANKEPVNAPRCCNHARAATNCGHGTAGSSRASISTNTNAAVVSPKPSGRNLNCGIESEAVEKIEAFRPYRLWG